MNFSEQFLGQHLKNTIFLLIKRFLSNMFLRKLAFFTEQTILLNELFYWTNDFTERTILLYKRFYWTDNFTERSFIGKANEINGKWTIILRRNESNFFNRLKKPNEMGRSRAMNERNEKCWTCSSLFIMLNAT